VRDENLVDKNPDRMTEEELARFYEERRDDESLWDKSRRIRVRRGSPSTVFTLRLAPEELELLYQAARREGETMSEFIRKAATDRAALTDRRSRRKAKSA
jgi:hypothetical protein